MELPAHGVDKKDEPFNEILQYPDIFAVLRVTPEGTVSSIYPPWGIELPFTKLIVYVTAVSETTYEEGVTITLDESMISIVAVTAPVPIVPWDTKPLVLVLKKVVTEKVPDGAIDGAFFTDKTVILKVWFPGMDKLEEFIFDNVIEFWMLLYVQVGMLTVLFPIIVAHPVDKVGVMVLGNIIWIIPDEENPSVTVIFIL